MLRVLTLFFYFAFLTGCQSFWEEGESGFSCEPWASVPKQLNVDRLRYFGEANGLISKVRLRNLTFQHWGSHRVDDLEGSLYKMKSIGKFDDILSIGSLGTRRIVVVRANSSQSSDSSIKIMSFPKGAVLAESGPRPSNLRDQDAIISGGRVHIVSEVLSDSMGDLRSWQVQRLFTRAGKIVFKDITDFKGDFKLIADRGRVTGLLNLDRGSSNVSSRLKVLRLTPKAYWKPLLQFNLSDVDSWTGAVRGDRYFVSYLGGDTYSGTAYLESQVIQPGKKSEGGRFSIGDYDVSSSEIISRGDRAYVIGSVLKSQASWIYLWELTNRGPKKIKSYGPLDEGISIHQAFSHSKAIGMIISERGKRFNKFGICRFDF